MNRYTNGKIYKLVNDVDSKVYIGSTCLPLSKRKSSHKDNARRYPNRHVYAHLNSVGWENVRIVLIESVNAETKDQLLMREQHYIDLLSPSLNKLAAFVAECPHNIKNKEQCKLCGGSQICEHNREKQQCIKCNGDKYYCYECCQVFCGKHVLDRHLTCITHKEKYIELMKNVFDHEMTVDEVPLY